MALDEGIRLAEGFLTNPLSSRALGFAAAVLPPYGTQAFFFIFFIQRMSEDC